MKKLIVGAFAIAVTLVIGAAASAQQTVGLFQNDAETFDGYTMFAKAGTTYLIDNAGLVVHTWNKSNSNTHPGYLMSDGNLIDFEGSSFRVLDWDSNVLWSYRDSSSHHDVEPLPNGNVLVITRDTFTSAEALAAGRDPATLNDSLRALSIHEIDESGAVVWEWNLWDHLIQDFDNTKANFGVVEDNPQLVDINFHWSTTNDWNHTNAISYNANLDQIMVSVRNFNELWVIDHSTTTAEAASSSGGDAGMGGDILYRWGNPQAYRAGDASDQQLFGQHDAHWIPPGLPGAGNMLIFNNGNADFDGPDYSTIVEIEPPLSGVNYTLTGGDAYGPAAPTWTYNSSPVTDFFSVFVSGSQRLPNGNTLIDQGANGTLFEVTSSGLKVWEYVNPVIDSGPLDWDDVPGPQGQGFLNSLFNVAKYPKSHPAFVGKDLTPTGEIEGWTNYASLTLQSTAGGNVTSRPEGTYDYGVGQLVTLIAEADPGFVFTGWTVEAGPLVIPGAADIHTTVSMGGTDATVSANFAVAETFSDVTTAAGFFGVNNSMQVSVLDYDDDGFLDLITSGHVQDVVPDNITQVWHNNGDGTFSDVTTDVGYSHYTGDPHGVVAADFDNDGDADFYVTKGSDRSGLYNNLMENDGNGMFADIAESAGVKAIDPNNRRHNGRGGYSIDFDLDGLLDIFVTNFGDNPETGDSNLLFRNDGGLLFTNVAVGTAIELNTPVNFNRTASWADFDQDGYPDALIMGPCTLVRNLGDGTFEDVTATAGISPDDDCNSSAWLDFDRDADLDLYVSRGPTGAFGGASSWPDRLYRNNGDGTFTDVTSDSGIDNEENARGVIAADYDNDGNMDLYIANAARANLLYRNNGDGTFSDVASSTGTEDPSAGGSVDATFFDHNNDGFLDIFVTHGISTTPGPYLLLENSGNANHWLDVRFRGLASNRDGIGTKLLATTSQGSQFREHSGPIHYFSQDRSPVHFGLGADTVVERLELTWPSGVVQTVENLAADQLVTIVEGRSIAQGPLPLPGNVGYDIAWRNFFGDWVIRWRGESGMAHRFRGQITTDGNFTDVTSKTSGPGDSVEWDQDTINFAAFARGNSESITFSTTGTTVTFAILQDGVEEPRSIRIGKQGIRPGRLPLTLTK